MQEGGTVTYNCSSGLATAEGLASFTETCQTDGWSVTGNCSRECCDAAVGLRGWTPEWWHRRNTQLLQGFYGTTGYSVW